MRPDVLRHQVVEGVRRIAGVIQAEEEDDTFGVVLYALLVGALLILVQTRCI